MNLNIEVWTLFPYISITAISFWFTGIFFLINKKKSDVWFILGSILIAVFIFMLSAYLERPPLRTLGETRLCYSLILSITGFILWKRWRFTWIVIYTHLLASLFLIINILHPETYDKSLMPALQSYWFIPHVTVYMLAYAALTVASLSGFKGLAQIFKLASLSNIQKTLLVSDYAVRFGFVLMTMGLVFGALWAKEAWGHYWTWDPKETWALLTWLIYLSYLHIRINHPDSFKLSFAFLVVAFFTLMLCWLGINYMPSAQYSVHVYE